MKRRSTFAHRPFLVLGCRFDLRTSPHPHRGALRRSRAGCRPPRHSPAEMTSAIGTVDTRHRTSAEIAMPWKIRVGQDHAGAADQRKPGDHDRTRALARSQAPLRARRFPGAPPSIAKSTNRIELHDDPGERDEPDHRGRGDQPRLPVSRPTSQRPGTMPRPADRRHDDRRHQEVAGTCRPPARRSATKRHANAAPMSEGLAGHGPFACPFGMPKGFVIGLAGHGAGTQCLAVWGDVVLQPVDLHHRVDRRTGGVRRASPTTYSSGRRSRIDDRVFLDALEAAQFRQRQGRAAGSWCGADHPVPSGWRRGPAAPRSRSRSVPAPSLTDIGDLVGAIAVDRVHHRCASTRPGRGAFWVSITKRRPVWLAHVKLSTSASPFDGSEQWSASATAPGDCALGP